MLSYGGDGTFLEAVKLAYGCGVPVLGINYGHLGFLANTPREDMREVVGILRRANIGYSRGRCCMSRAAGISEDTPTH